MKFHAAYGEIFFILLCNVQSTYLLRRNIPLYIVLFFYV